MKLLLIVLMLTVLTGWSLEEVMQEFGEGVRTGVSNTEGAIKEAPAAISKAGNKVEDDIKKDDKDSAKKDDSEED